MYINFAHLPKRIFVSLCLPVMATNITITTPSGKLNGLFQRSSEGNDYYAFRGIPYAKPPIGPLRFCDPEPNDIWIDVRDATKHGPVSMQYDSEKNIVIGSEDCLYANVYTRSVKFGARAPVMVWIHGGGFVKGSGNDNMFGPDFLLQKDIVLVTFNYRLGVFGFLNLEDEKAPGNQGLKDQVRMLKWVKTHIAYFGGDSDNVTIFGGSAGATSVHYLALSPLAKGLFHKGICQSGCALSPWAVKNEPKKTVYEFLEILGFEKRDPEAIVTYLKTANCYKMIEAQKKLMSLQTQLQLCFPFGPGVDNKSPNAFMPTFVSDMAERGVQVPLMIGYNSMESLLMFNALNNIDINEIDHNFNNFVHPHIFDVLEDYELKFEDLRKMYFKGEKISKENIKDLLKFYHDIHFIESLERLARIQVQNGAASTYFYKLSYDKNLTLSLKDLNLPIRGANHGDELNYLFKANICDVCNFQQLNGDSAKKLMQQMVELWVNFAKTGIPTPTKSELIQSYWLPLNNDVVLRYFNIDEELSMKKKLNIDQSFRRKTKY